METIKLDLIPGKKMPSLHASQYDDGRDYHIDLTENRVPYVLDGTETISLTVRKCDNTLVTMDIANTFADKSYIEFRTTEQMNACAGFNYGEITLEKNGTRIGSLNFYLQVEGAPDEGGITSQSEINNLNRQVHDAVVEELEDNGASETGYDNTESGLEATNVQDAIDELASATPEDVYTKEETNDKFATKTALQTVANAIPTKTSELQNDSVFATIDDTEESSEKTFSSEKIETELDGKTNAQDFNNLVTTLTDSDVLQKVFTYEQKLAGYTIISGTGQLNIGAGNTDAYIYKVSEADKFVLGNGTMYGLFASLPARYSVTVDTDRHYITTDPVTIPLGVAYLVVIAATNKIPTVNRINKTIGDAFDVDIKFDKQGFISATTGNFVSNADYRATDFVELFADGTFIPFKYRLQMFKNTAIAYYDEDYTVVSKLIPSSSDTLEYVEGIADFVEGAKYIRLCSYKDMNDCYLRYATVKNRIDKTNSDASNPCNYDGNDISIFNKILCIGDSLTEGTFNYRQDGDTGHYVNITKYSYPTYLKKITGCDVTNLGNGGMTSDEWYAYHSGDDLSGYDCAIIQLGVNDAIRYGTWGATSEDAFANIITKLKTENNNIKIFVANIIPATSYSNATILALSDALLSWVQTTYANDNNVIPLDIQQYGHTKDSVAYNCGHLSAFGYLRLAKDYKAYLSWYIDNNKTQFKEVQFIGTNYHYDP